MTWSDLRGTDAARSRPACASISVLARGRPRVVRTSTRGEKFGLVGESGSGKSVTALSILRLVEAATYEGAIRFDGEDLLQKSERQMRGVRGRDIAMIFQEPMTALNPLYTVGNQIGEVLELHEGLRKNAARGRAIELLHAHRHSRSGEEGRRVSRISSRAASASAR